MPELDRIFHASVASQQANGNAIILAHTSSESATWITASDLGDGVEVVMSWTRWQVDCLFTTEAKSRNRTHSSDGPFPDGLLKPDSRKRL